jgi:hypothetical protein
LSQFPGSGIDLRNESGAVADSYGVRVRRMSTEAPDQSGRTDADLQIGHNLKKGHKMILVMKNKKVIT